MAKNTKRRQKKDKERQKRKEQAKKNQRLETHVDKKDRKQGFQNLMVLLGVSLLALVAIIYFLET